VLASDAVLLANKDHWLVRETIGAAAPHAGASGCVLAQPVRADREGSCFAGTLAELAFCADRAYMLVLPDDAEQAPTLT
jgi:benzoyl-CoA-dihydrodiol lyase